MNQADALTYSTEKVLEEMKGKADQAKLDSVKKKNDELKELLGKEPKDIPAIKAKMEELNKDMQAIGTEIYQKAAQEAAKKQQGQQEAAGGKEEKKKDEKVVDADYEVKDDKEKEEKK